MSESKDAERDDAVTPASTSSTEPDDKESADYPTPETTGEVIPPTLKRREDWYVTNADDKRAYAPWKAGTERFVSWLPPRDGNDKDTDYAGTFEDAREWVDEYGAFDYYGTRSLATAPDEKRLVFLDFDDVRDPESGEIHPQAWKMVSETGLFATLSSSGTGIHGYVWAESVPPEMKPSFVNELDGWEHTDNPELEFYAQDRFIVFTGEHLEDTATEIPTRSEMVHTFINDHSEPKHERMATEPERDRSEIEDVETTTDTEVVMDAISHTTPSDVRLDSDKTGEAKEGVVRDPSYENSDSGERILDYEDGGFFDRNASEPFDILDLVAAEEDIISTPTDGVEGEAFWNAVDALRDRGAPIPEYDDSFEMDDDVVGDDDRGDEFWSLIHDGYEDDEMSAGELHWYIGSHLAQLGYRNIRATDELWKYVESGEDVGIYKPNGRSFVRSTLTTELRQHFNRRAMNESIEHLKGRTTIDDFEQDEAIIRVKNGALTVPTESDPEVELKDHSPEYEFLSGLDVEYDPDAECRAWVELVEETFVNEAHAKKFQEYAGYALLNSQPWDKILFLVGPSRTGKSQVIEGIEYLFREEAMSTVSPQGLCNTRWDAAALHGAMLNTDKDISTNTLEQMGDLRKAASGEELRAEKKGEQKFDFEPHAAHIFGANQLPDATIDDTAFYNRIMLCEASGVVDERGDKIVDELGKKIAEEQGPGILNWMLEGLRRRVEQGFFTGALPDAEMTRRRWKAWSQSHHRFAHRICEYDGSTVETYEDIQEAFDAFCDEKGYAGQVSTQKLNNAIIERGDGDVVRSSTTRDGETKSSLKGVCIDPKYHPNKDESESTED